MNNDRINLFDGFALDLARGCLVRDGGLVHLRPQSYEVLKYLVENKGHLISKDKLIEEVWKGRAVTDGSLGKCIEEVREALGENAKDYVRNVRGRGYIFDQGVAEGSKSLSVRSEQIDVVKIIVEEEENNGATWRDQQLGLGPSQDLPSNLAALTNLDRGAVPQTMRSTSMAGPALDTVRRYRWATLVLAALVVSAGVFAYFNYSRNRSAPITSIAVLPFANGSGDTNLEYLSDGLSESLIDRLSQLPGVKVIARSSSFKYKGKEVDPRAAAQALGVEALVTGRVVQRGDELQVRAELVDTRSGTQVWGEQYSRRTADIQAVQEEMARTISEKLHLRLSGAREQQPTKHMTQNPQAYQVYLNGLFSWRKRGFENVRRALEYYNQAVTLDPNFALAWVGIANAYRELQAKSLLDPKVALTRAKAAAQKALELDEMLPTAHVTMARIKHDEWDFVEAERGYKRAIELNPNLAEARARYSAYLSAMGRHTEALAEGNRAQDLDPLASSWRGWGALYSARRYDELIERIQLAIKLEPDVGVAHGVLAVTYAAKGMHEQAIDEYQRCISIDGETTSTLCYLGHALAMSGKRTEAAAILNKLKTTKEYVSPAELAVLYVGLGDEEEALKMLEKGYETHDPLLSNLKVDPLYDSLRSDPRFQDLLRRVGFAP